MPTEVLAENKCCHCKGSMARYHPDDCLSVPVICANCVTLIYVGQDGKYRPRYVADDGSYVVGYANV